MQVSHWKAAMDEELQALLSRDTWALIDRPLEAAVVGCRNTRLMEL